MREVRVALLLASVVALVAQGCGDDGEDASSTTLTTAAATTTTVETTTTGDPQEVIRAAVIAAYDAHWKDYLRAGNPPTPDAPFLADHHTGRVLTGTRNNLTEFQAEGIAIRGTYEVDVVVTQLDATAAVIEDCGLDRTEVFRSATGDIVEDSDDVRDGVVADIVLEDGLWKVSTLERDEGICDRRGNG